MALPEYSLGDDFVLTPVDVTPEVQEMFGEHCRRTELGMLKDIYRERIRVEAPFPVSAGEEADIFRSVFTDEDV